MSEPRAFNRDAFAQICALRRRLDQLAQRCYDLETENLRLRTRLHEEMASAEEAWESKLHLEWKLQDLEAKG